MTKASDWFSTSTGTGDQADARHALQRLTADDPAVAANMARHAVAAGVLVTGVRREHRAEVEAQFLSGFVLSDGEFRSIAAAVKHLGGSHVFLAFDVDDALGEPRGLGVIREEGDAIATYPRCGIWAPANDGRAVIVPYGDGAPSCHFVARRNRPMARIEGLPSGDLEAGLRRGQHRLARLVRSAQFRDAHVGARRSVIQSVKGGFEVESDLLAA